MRRRIVEAFEVLAGWRAPSRPSWLTGVALGCWWFFLVLVVFATIGRATKFIYVDF